MNSYNYLLSRIRTVRRRWRAQMLVKGIGLFLAAGALVLGLGVWGGDLFGFRPAAVWILRGITGVALILVALRFLYLPLSRRVSDIQIARFVEERFPELQDRLVTAVEYGGTGRVSPGLLDLLIRDALTKSSRLDFGVFLEPRRLTAYGAAGGGAVLVLLALLSWGPSFFRYGFDLLYVRWAEASSEKLLRIEVLPGDATLARGSDQLIEARLIGFDSPDVSLHLQTQGAAWTSAAMEPLPQGSGFRYLFVDLNMPQTYYVESAGVRSPTFTISIVDVPRVERIDAIYEFPAYTGMPRQTEEGAGDISALRGTRVEVRVKMSRRADSARLLFDDGSSLELTPAGEQDYAGRIHLQRSGTYLVQITEDGRSMAGSPEHAIDAIEDAAPQIRITKPMRDVRATSVEEVFSEIRVEDDVGTAKVEMRFSVNGGPEKTAELYNRRGREKLVTAPYTFFLEEYGLQPGDLVSYYGLAQDNNNVTGPGKTASDIYFIQIRPFEQNYSQSQQSAMPGQQGEEGAGEALSGQQKDIISATFRLIRDRDKMAPKEYTDGLKALALVQSRLQAQAQGLVDRFGRRGAAEAGEQFARLGEYLKGAIEAMSKAAVQLGAGKPEEALPEEQKALQQLMRAESLFRDIQVSFGTQSGGGGGGGSQANAEDLADLFELELNKLRNQYETIQRGERQERDQQVDEATQRLKELAQRQQQLNERSRMMRQQAGSSSQSSAGGGSQQRQLLEEAERLQRQLQRLSRERSSAELSRVSSRLQQAIEEMRRASERSGSREAEAGGIRALQQLEEAQRALAREQNAGLNQGIESAAAESRRLVEEQKRIQEGVERLGNTRSESAAAEGAKLREELSQRKDVLADRVDSLGNRVEELGRQARREQGESARRLSEAAEGLRDRRLADRIRSSDQLLESGSMDIIRGREGFIRSGLEELSRRLEEARNSLGSTREGRLGEAVDRTRQLAEGLESMQQRMTDRQAADSSRAGGPPIGTGPYRSDDPRQLSREMQQRITDVQELRRLLDRNSTEWRNLENVINALRDMSAAGRYDDPEEIARLKRAIDLLRGVELDLNRTLEQLTRKDRYLYADDNEVPGIYRRLVEEYYKALARIKP